MTASTQFMDRALELARTAESLGEVPVGAVIVNPQSGAIIGEGHNRPIMDHDPSAHAEIAALRTAALKLGNYRLNGLHLYVTLEPCTMCAGAISLARIERLVFAAPDPKGGAVIHGVKFFDSPSCHWRPDVSQDTEAGEISSDLLRKFFRSRRKKLL